ncbi:ATP-binding cassette [Spiroplasma sp. TIUS-1]|uniref:ABC transporter ATP-binding protein n=1 Tax=Spiroplasma sp. TIUS-1 TaxID=216963 RepID=UPI001399054C|nr:ABC transporter ATP-binding protein [Spiroplasma sp. TIUS-1]QHX36063.1 ATP-binding cassette [Spiroplasma sp. TIUS-1]
MEKFTMEFDKKLDEKQVSKSVIEEKITKPKLFSKFESDYAFTWKKFMGAFKQILPVFKKHWFLSLVFFGSIFLQGFAFGIVPIISKVLIESVTAESGHAMFLGVYTSWTSMVWIAVGLLIFMGLSEWILEYAGHRLQNRVEVYLRLKTVESMIRVDMSWYSKNVLGETMSKVMTDSTVAGDMLTNFCINFFYTIIFLFTVITTMFMQDVFLAAIITSVLLVVFIILFLIFILYRRSLITAFNHRLKIDGEMTDRIMNIRLLKSSGTENEEIKIFEDKHENWGKSVDITIGYSAWIAVIASTTALVIPVLSIFLAILYHHVGHGMGITELVPIITSFTISAYMMSNLTQLLPMIFRFATRLSNSMMRLERIISIKSLVQNKPGAITVKDTSINDEIETIEFRDVDFSYPEDDKHLQIIEGLNIKLEKGKSYAFVGESGVGKSTITKMLMRFYDTTKGQVLINGVDIKDYQLTNYLDHVGYVDQEPQIFFGTIMENIRYTNVNATDEEVFAASKSAKFHDFVLSMPDGYETVAGQQGFMLSGGQKQRLVIARMFLKNPSLIVLDEATSALDNVVEKEILASFEALSKGRTTVAIAHRLSTIINYDIIYVIGRNKNVIESGSFNELMKLEGQFAKLYRMGQI